MDRPDDEVRVGPSEESKAGTRQAFDEQFTLVYHELRRLAEQQRQKWGGDHSLNTTALVHEAFLRLGRDAGDTWRSQSHFMAVAATAMRQILIDHARRQHAAKRGSGQRHLTLDELESALSGTADAGDTSADALIAVDEALARLGAHDARLARIVECRFFGGMAIRETAEALGISTATVKRGWAMAQAWLHRELSQILGAQA
ncbi:MAG: ECF-type sigma factor [Gemmatimonadaceae bacterium]